VAQINLANNLGSGNISAIKNVFERAIKTVKVDKFSGNQRQTQGKQKAKMDYRVTCL
jgi:hypothetical protein